MGKRLLLHIGSPKTATSSIQSFLYTHSDFLKKHGYHYLQSGLSDGHRCHHDLIWTLELHPGLSYVPNKIKNYKEELLNRLEEEENRYKDFDIIISSELLFFLNDVKKLDLLLKRFSSRELVVLISLRRQDKFLESLYQQIIKDGGTKEFREWFVHAKNIGNYNQLFNRWMKIADRKNILINIFDSRIEDFHPIKSFLTLIGFDQSLVDELQIENLKINESLTRDQVDILVESNKKNPKKRFELINNFIEENKMMSEKGKIEFFTKEERNKIIQSYIEPNLNLYKRSMLNAAQARYLFY